MHQQDVGAEEEGHGHVIPVAGIDGRKMKESAGAPRHPSPSAHSHGLSRSQLLLDHMLSLDPLEWASSPSIGSFRFPPPMCRSALARPRVGPDLGLPGQDRAAQDAPCRYRFVPVDWSTGRTDLVARHIFLTHPHPPPPPPPPACTHMPTLSTSTSVLQPVDSGHVPQSPVQRELARSSSPPVCPLHRVVYHRIRPLCSHSPSLFGR